MRPHYWSDGHVTRNYGHTAQIGHEETPAAYVEALRQVFAEARRVLADDGTLWLNVGDCNVATSDGGARQQLQEAAAGGAAEVAAGGAAQKPARYAVAGRVLAAGRRVDPAQYVVDLHPAAARGILCGIPLDLPLRCIAVGCRPCGTVCDPFAGVGTTGIAARQLERQFTGIEYPRLLRDRYAAAQGRDRRRQHAGGQR